MFQGVSPAAPLYELCMCACAVYPALCELHNLSRVAYFLQASSDINQPKRNEVEQSL